MVTLDGTLLGTTPTIINLTKNNLNELSHNLGIAIAEMSEFIEFN